MDRMAATTTSTDPHRKHSMMQAQASYAGKLGSSCCPPVWYLLKNELPLLPHLCRGHLLGTFQPRQFELVLEASLLSCCALAAL